MRAAPLKWLSRRNPLDEHFGKVPEEIIINSLQGGDQVQRFIFDKSRN